MRRAGFNAVGLGIGQDEDLRIGAALEPDPGQAADAAVPTIAAGHVAGGHHLLAAIAVAQCGRGGIRGVAQVGQFNAPFHGHVGRGQVLAEDAFGLGLGQEQQERVGGVIQAEVEHWHRQYPAGDVHAQLHSPVPGGNQLVGDTKSGQNLQGARLDRQRAGLMHPVQPTVDQAGPNAEGGQLRSEGQPSRPGTDHEHVGQLAGHDATLRLATGADTPKAERSRAVSPKRTGPADMYADHLGWLCPMSRTGRSVAWATATIVSWAVDVGAAESVRYLRSGLPAGRRR